MSLSPVVKQVGIGLGVYMLAQMLFPQTASAGTASGTSAAQTAQSNALQKALLQMQNQLKSLASQMAKAKPASGGSGSNAAKSAAKGLSDAVKKALQNITKPVALEDTGGGLAGLIGYEPLQGLEGFNDWSDDDGSAGEEGDGAWVDTDQSDNGFGDIEATGELLFDDGGTDDWAGMDWGSAEPWDESGEFY